MLIRLSFRNIKSNPHLIQFFISTIYSDINYLVKRFLMQSNAIRICNLKYLQHISLYKKNNHM